jgi:hypothetical protein
MKRREPPAKTAKRRTRLRRKPGQPSPYSKLNNAIESKICQYIQAGLRYEDACGMCDITRQTYHNWRVRGAEDPKGRYGKFLAKCEKALLQSKAAMVAKLRVHDDPRWTWKLMINRWPDEFREAFALRQEISGPAGGPVPVAMALNPFQVEVIINGELPAHPPIEELLNGSRN